MASKIQIRRDTFANWNAVSGSVILAAGEIGYETDTRNLKIGDGTNVWSALKYQAPVYSGTNSTLAAATLAVDQTNNRVGIGTATPQQKLDVNGNIASNRTAAGSFLVSGDGAYMFGTDSKQYIYGTPGNSGQVAINTSNASGTVANTLVVTSGQVTANGIFSATGINAAASGLTSSGGLTVSSGVTSLTGGLTVVSGGISFPDNSIPLADIAQIATLTVLGNSTGAAANVAALTSGASGTARTALGLNADAYIPRVIENHAYGPLTNIVLGTGVNCDIDVSAQTLGVEYWYKWSTTSTTTGTLKQASVRMITGGSTTFSYIYKWGGKIEPSGWATAEIVNRHYINNQNFYAYVIISNGTTGATGVSTGYISVTKSVSIA